MPPWSSDTVAVQGRAFIRLTMMTEARAVFGVGLVALHFCSASFG